MERDLDSGKKTWMAFISCVAVSKSSLSLSSFSFSIYKMGIIMPVLAVTENR